MSDDAWLTDEVVTAVAIHMNTDHAEDNVVICRGLGEHAATFSAQFTGMTTREAVFAATDEDGSEHEVRVRFANEVTARPEVRAEIASLYHRSAELLGLPPRTADS